MTSTFEWMYVHSICVRQSRHGEAQFTLWISYVIMHESARVSRMLMSNIHLWW